MLFIILLFWLVDRNSRIFNFLDPIESLLTRQTIQSFRQLRKQHPGYRFKSGKIQRGTNTGFYGLLAN